MPQDIPSLLVEAPPHHEADRVKWTAPPRSQSNGLLQPHHPRCFGFQLHAVAHACFSAGKAFYNEVSVAMTGVALEGGGSSYGLTPMSKAGFGQDLDWYVALSFVCMHAIHMRLCDPLTLPAALLSA